MLICLGESVDRKPSVCPTSQCNIGMLPTIVLQKQQYRIFFYFIDSDTIIHPIYNANTQLPNTEPKNNVSWSTQPSDMPTPEGLLNSTIIEKGRKAHGKYKGEMIAPEVSGELCCLQRTLSSEFIK